MSDNGDQPTKKIWPKDEPETFEQTEESADDFEAVEEETEESSEQGAIEAPSHEELELKLTEAEQLAHEYWNKFTRTQAEIENIQRRAERDVANAHKFGIEKFAIELLNVMDSLDRGLECRDEIADDERALKVYEGLSLTRDLMMSTLERFGVVQINPKNEEFDPKLHEAISMVESPDASTNTVIQVMSPGYTLNDRLIRPAMVVVAK